MYLYYFLHLMCFLNIVSVDGNYSEWSEFQACSVTCGKGIQARSRSCINPPPQHGGKNCSAYGPPVETKECNLRECPSMHICCISLNIPELHIRVDKTSTAFTLHDTCSYNNDLIGLFTWRKNMQNLGCISLGESKIGFLIQDHTDSLLPKK